MALPPALATRVNGKIYDFSSVEIMIGHQIFTNVTEISYSHGLDPGVLRGTAATMRGRSRGTYEADGSFSIYKEDYFRLIAELAPQGLGGYMMAEFMICVAYRELGMNVPCMDILEGCRIKRDDDSHSSGGDPIITRVELSVKSLSRNGLTAYDIAGVAKDLTP